MNNSKVNGSPISQNGRFVNPFSENFFEGFIAHKLSDVKSFLKYFSGSPEAQTEENVKTFFKIFFGAELRNKVANLTAELDASEYRTFVYPRTIKGASTAEFIKTKREYDKLRVEVISIRQKCLSCRICTTLCWGRPSLKLSVLRQLLKCM